MLSRVDYIPCHQNVRIKLFPIKTNTCNTVFQDMMLTAEHKSQLHQRIKEQRGTSMGHRITRCLHYHFKTQTTKRRKKARKVETWPVLVKEARGYE